VLCIMNNNHTHIHTHAHLTAGRERETAISTFCVRWDTCTPIYALISIVMMQIAMPMMAVCVRVSTYVCENVCV
jgi:hypothetical protein